MSSESSVLIRTFEHLFALSPKEREHLQELTVQTENVEPRRKLITEGKACPQMYLVVSGWLTESKQLRDGQRQILSFPLPGDLVGLECLAYKKALHSTAALTRCTVAPLTTEKFEHIQREYPRLATALFLMTLRESAILHEWEVNLGRRVAFQRVAHLLLELNYRLHRRGLADGHAVPFPLTQEEIADGTGLTTPYVNRLLQKMRSDGLLEIDDRTLTIFDPAELGRVAGFKPEYIERWGDGHLTIAAEHASLPSAAR